MDEIPEFFLQHDDEIVRMMSLPLGELEKEFEEAKARGSWVSGLEERAENE